MSSSARTALAFGVLPAAIRSLVVANINSMSFSSIARSRHSLAVSVNLRRAAEHVNADERMGFVNWWVVFTPHADQPPALKRVNVSSDGLVRPCKLTPEPEQAMVCCQPSGAGACGTRAEGYRCAGWRVGGSTRKFSPSRRACPTHHRLSRGQVNGACDPPAWCTFGATAPSPSSSLTENVNDLRDGP